jgi:hypothetical protein
MIHMGERTYREDKEIFEKQYPGRIAIDVPKLEAAYADADVTIV